MKNTPITPEEAKNLKFPRLMEVWDYDRNDDIPMFRIVCGLSENGSFITSNGSFWDKAAEVPSEIAEAMREQFAFQPQRMLVWDGNKTDAVERMVIADLGERVKNRYIVVAESYESDYKSGNEYSWACYLNAKPIPTDPIRDEIEALKKRIAELEQKRNQ